MKRRFSIWSLFFLLACTNDPDCQNVEQTDLVSISFGNKSTGSAILFDSIILNGIGQYSDTLAGDMSLPIDISSSSSTYVFNSLNQSDTLTIEYQARPVIFSEDCGVNMAFSGLLVRRTTFDSVVLLNQKLSSVINNSSNRNRTNLEIYD